MGELIVFRALQGLGGGGLMVTTMAVVGDMFSPRERGRYQGIFGGVFGLSTVLGPLIGGFFVEHLSWRWIFYVNLPLGLVAVAIIGWTFTARRVRRQPAIDVAGAACLAVTADRAHPAHQPRRPCLRLEFAENALDLAVGVVALAGFIVGEHRPPSRSCRCALFGNRVFVDRLRGRLYRRPRDVRLGHLHAAVSAGREGHESRPSPGCAHADDGRRAGHLDRQRSNHQPDRPLPPVPDRGDRDDDLRPQPARDARRRHQHWVACGYMLVLGLGLGMVMQILVLAVQNAVEYRDLGVATSGTTLFRSIGGSVGVSLFGAIFTASLAANLAARLPAGTTFPAATTPAAIGLPPMAAKTIYLDAFTAALHPVFLYAAAVSALGFALTWFLKDLPLRGRVRAETIDECFAMPRDASSVEELERIVTRSWRANENHREVYRRFAESSKVPLAPDAIWFLRSFASSRLLRRACGILRSIRRFLSTGSLRPLDKNAWFHARDDRASAQRTLSPSNPRSGIVPKDGGSRAKPDWSGCWNYGIPKTTRRSRRCSIVLRA